MLRIVPDIDKKFILDRLSQEEIFERFLGIPFDTTEKYTSPFREDRNPTCTFKRNPNGVVTFIDWSGDFLGNCFDAVIRIYGCSFWDACKIIAKEFDLVDGLKVGDLDRKPKAYEHAEKDITTIKTKWRRYENSDLSYWSAYGIHPATLRTYNVGPVAFAWVNEKLIYSNRKGDPCYGYFFNGEYKLYFPLREEWRFLGNFAGLQGYDQLPDTGDLLVITKSLKDVMFLHQMGIAAVAPSSESTTISKEQYQELSKRFKLLVSLYDHDTTGVRSATQMEEDFGIPALFFTEKGKDITDIAKNHCPTVAEITFKKLLSGYTRSRKT